MNKKSQNPDYTAEPKKGIAIFSAKLTNSKKMNPGRII